MHSWSSFRLPRPPDCAQLVESQCGSGRSVSDKPAPTTHRFHDRFKLTDRRMPERQVQSEAPCCIHLHDHHGNLCPKGFRSRIRIPDGSEGESSGIVTAQPPLGEKVSEMHVLKRDGRMITAPRDHIAKPIRSHRKIDGALDEGVTTGFGGAASVERSGLRTHRTESDHIAVAEANLPRSLRFENGLARRIR